MTQGTRDFLIGLLVVAFLVGLGLALLGWWLR